MITGPSTHYFRPLPDSIATPGARRIGGTGPWFSQVQVLSRTGPAQILPAEAVIGLFPQAEDIISAISRERPPLFDGMGGWPAIMGIVNVTPDSFSDGGQLVTALHAVEHGLSMAEQGAQILDIGGESTRPGAAFVSEAEELDRVMPVIEGLIAAKCAVPISIDTRKAGVAKAALAAGARLFNDVSALTHDENSTLVARTADAVCLMHAQGTPENMQLNPTYDDVVLDVFDFFEERLQHAEKAGLGRDRVVLDPGIGFGKTLTHNLRLLQHLSLFQSLGCALLLGVSRKGFIGALTGEKTASQRFPGSIAAGLSGLAQGCQILRVHDVGQTVQAVRVWNSMNEES